jgi:zinc/manganese transport system permease protein
MDQLFVYHYRQTAFVAGTIVALLAGVVGYLVVLRGQTFAAHAMSQIGFPGASGAVLFGISPLAGLAFLCSLSALGIQRFGDSRQGSRSRESAAIGSIQTFGLALGVLFVRLYHGFLSGLTGILFGSFLGISDQEVLQLAVITIAVLAVLAVLGRPLWFISIDPELAAARGVPVKALSALFLIISGLAVASVSLITGVLLVFSLLVAPAAAAQQLAKRPLWGFLLAVLIGELVVWSSLSIAFFTVLPVGFLVTTFGFAAYLTACGGRWAVHRWV